MTANPDRFVTRRFPRGRIPGLSRIRGQVPQQQRQSHRTWQRVEDAIDSGQPHASLCRGTAPERLEVVPSFWPPGGPMKVTSDI